MLQYYAFVIVKIPINTYLCKPTIESDNKPLEFIMKNKFAFVSASLQKSILHIKYNKILKYLHFFLFFTESKKQTAQEKQIQMQRVLNKINNINLNRNKK